MTTCTRTQDIDCGHRVVRQGGKCEHLHGHTYCIHFTCNAPALNAVGMVIDFGVMKSKLCQWLLDNWDHKFLVWTQDEEMHDIDPETMANSATGALLLRSLVWVPFNPTAENIAEYLLYVVGPMQLGGTGVQLIEVIVEETRKCSAKATYADR